MVATKVINYLMWYSRQCYLKCVYVCVLGKWGLDEVSIFFLRDKMSVPVDYDKIFMYIVISSATTKRTMQSDIFKILQLVKTES